MPPTPTAIEASSIFKRVFNRLPAFLGFVIAPYLYFTGSSYEKARLDALGIGEFGSSASAGDIVFSGFNVVANNTLPWIVDRFLLTLLVGFTLLFAAWWCSKSTQRTARISRIIYKRTVRFVRRIGNDIGIVLAPAAAIVFALLFITLFLGWLSAMSFGQKDGEKDAKKHLRKVQQCVSKGGIAPGCTRLSMRGADGKVAVIPASILLYDAQKMVISDGVSVRIYDPKQLVGVFRLPDERSKSVKN